MLKVTFVAACCAAAFLAIAAFFASGADACPRGTRFSGYGENCIVTGQGALEAVKCVRADGACPSGFKRHESNKDPGVFFCCPTSTDKLTYPPGMGPEYDNLACRWDGTAPICRGECKEGEFTKTASTDGRNMGKFKHSFGAKCESGFKRLCCREK